MILSAKWEKKEKVTKEASAVEDTLPTKEINKRKHESNDKDNENKALKVQLERFKRIMATMHNEIKELKDSNQACPG